MSDQNQNDPSPATTTLDYALPRQRVRRKFMHLSWLEALVVAMIVGVLIAILLPVIQSGESPSKRVGCMSNLRQIGLALTQYAARNNGVYPPRLVDAYTPSMQTRFFVCPASKTDVPAAAGATQQQTINNLLAGNNHISYIYVIGGMKAASMKPGMVAAYEAVGNHSSGLRGSGNVLFVDGHVSSLGVPVFKQMVKELNAGQNPPPALKGQY